MFPKPEPRATTKARKARQRAEADSAVYQAVTRRDEGRCRNCGGTWQLHRHHIRPRSLLFGAARTTTTNVICLCLWCHQAIHAGRLVMDGADADALVTFRRR